MSRDKAIRSRGGFTLVEVLVTMAVFIVVMVIAAETFNNIVTVSSRVSKSEESNIEGVIGLEIMRHDLEQIGFGLPWGFCRPASGTTDGSCVNTDISYQEATDATGLTLNDAPGGVPRALTGIDSPAGFLSDFIALKGTTVGISKASQRWTYINFQNVSTATGRISRPVSWPSNNLLANDKVTLIRANFNVDTDDHLLIGSPGDSTVFYSDYGAIGAESLPQNDQQTHMVYGIDDAETPRMPFNRSDYFVSSAAGTVPPFCAPSTGVLYKMTVGHSNGAYVITPLLDCVADMQVVLGWDTSDKGMANAIDAWSSLPSASTGDVTASGPSGVATSIKSWLTDAGSLREHLKMVKIYLLAQEGKVDRYYTYPQSSVVVGNSSTEQSLTRLYTFAPNQLNYRWKLYRIIARPKNLLSNQR